jgi:hypothetical protein
MWKLIESVKTVTGWWISSNQNNSSVGNVFWLPIRQSKFFGTIEFLVSIYGKILVILSPNLDISYRSLDLNIFKFAAL